MKKLTRIISAMFLLWTMVCGLSTASAAVPHLINYQGRLTDANNNPLNGSYNLTFRIYDAENAGNMLWQGTYSNVPIVKGIFNILLGDVNDTGFNFSNLSFDKPYWLEIKVGTDAPMTPRQRITSAGYAITAENGVPQGVVVMWSGSITNIPSGWALCDGTNGTPDLRDRFIVGAGSNYTVSATGGEAMHTLTITEIPAHTHSYRFWPGWYFSGSSEYGAKGGPDDNHQTGSAGGGQPHENRPPYYALAYIMKL